MTNWKKLGELNLKEVAARTQIELDFFKYLLEKDFKGLGRFNVRGFVKILAREYELDFDDFLQEYEGYLAELNPAPVAFADKTIVPRLDSSAQKKSSPWMWILLLVALGIVGLFYYLDSAQFWLKKEQAKASPAQDLNSGLILISPADQEPGEKEDEKSQGNLAPADTKAPAEELASAKTAPQESGSQTSLAEGEEKNENGSEGRASGSYTANFASFTPSTKVWVGIIDLENFKKSSFVKEGPFEISLSKDQLVLTGAAGLELKNESGEPSSYRAGISKRFLIKNGRISPISTAEFIRLNQGRGW